MSSSTTSGFSLLLDFPIITVVLSAVCKVPRPSLLFDYSEETRRTQSFRFLFTKREHRRLTDQVLVLKTEGFS